MGNTEPMTDERLAAIHTQLEEARRREEIGGMIGATHHYVLDVTTLLAEVERLREENEFLRKDNDAAQKQIERLCERNSELRDIVRRVAEEDNSDSSLCYQLCPMRWVSDSPSSADYTSMEHTGPCVVEQARAALAGPAAIGEQAAAAEESEASAHEDTDCLPRWRGRDCDGRQLQRHALWREPRWQ